MKLSDYTSVVGQPIIDDLRLLGGHLEGKRIRNVNSTAVGGGVAEILNRMVPLLNELGVQTSWDIIRGGDQFFGVTKKIHNTLQGNPGSLSEKEKEIYWETQNQNSKIMDLEGDIVFIHDPQPAGLITSKKKPHQKWIWRCHIDMSKPSSSVWKFLKPIVQQYDATVFSSPAFGQTLDNRQILIAPSIDPLSDKNKELPQEFINEVLERFQLDPARPLLTQVSRFDYHKDPIGVIEAYQMAKKYVDAQLLLVGGSATDDPEGSRVLSEVKEKAAQDKDIHVLELPPTSHLEINALQRASTIIFQKSIKEGFGLTVTEALWKAKPVIAGAVGGIPLQITHKYSGALTHSVEGTAYWIKQFLQSPDYARRMGENGREHVRENFLLTRHLRDYLMLFLSVQHPAKNIIYL